MQRHIDVSWSDVVASQVEFPEARIYEETLNSMLFENVESRPDAELMQATRGPTSSSYHSDDEGEYDRHVHAESVAGKLRRK